MKPAHPRWFAIGASAVCSSPHYAKTAIGSIPVARQSTDESRLAAAGIVPRSRRTRQRDVANARLSYSNITVALSIQPVGLIRSARSSRRCRSPARERCLLLCISALTQAFFRGLLSSKGHTATCSQDGMLIKAGHIYVTPTVGRRIKIILSLLSHTRKMR